MNDQDIERQWRAQSTETPRERTDAAIRAAARRELRRRPAWTRYAPLAAAASVGVIAILLVRQSPRDDLTRVAPIDAQVITEEAITEKSAAAGDTAMADDTAAPAAPVAPAPPPPSPAATPSPAAAPVPVPPASEARKAVPPAPAATELRRTEIQRRAATAADAAASADKAAPAAEDAAISAYANGDAEAALPVQLVELITADAAAVASVDPQDVEIVSWESVTWSDGSLGCGTRGEIAIQVLTPGYRVKVLAGGESLEYHTDQHQLVRLCRTIKAGGER